MSGLRRVWLRFSVELILQYWTSCYFQHFAICLIRERNTSAGNLICFYSCAPLKLVMLSCENRMDCVVRSALCVCVCKRVIRLLLCTICFLFTLFLLLFLLMEVFFNSLQNSSDPVRLKSFIRNGATLKNVQRCTTWVDTIDFCILLLLNVRTRLQNNR